MARRESDQRALELDKPAVKEIPVPVATSVLHPSLKNSAEGCHQRPEVERLHHCCNCHRSPAVHAAMAMWTAAAVAESAAC